MTQTESYNERLFSGSGLRSFFHLARFHWARNIVSSSTLDPVRLVEIGCFDGRLIEYIPRSLELYCGYDAGWEGGLDRGRSRYADRSEFSFEMAVDPEPLAAHGDDHFNLGAALETIEHVPPDLVEPYLAELARIVDGYLIITVPNEKGLIFLGKYVAKKLFYGGSEHYSFRELLSATFGRMEAIERNEHKGFDYAQLIRQIERHFDVVAVQGLPYRRLPASLSFTVGILARSKAGSAVKFPA